MESIFEFGVHAFLGALISYAALGVLFAAPFVVFGVQRLDSDARGSGWGFRLLIFPGVAAFWPMFLSRWIRKISEPPVERNPHRTTSL